MEGGEVNESARIVEESRENVGAGVMGRNMFGERGIEELRELVDQLSGTDEGIVLVGSAGITSHLGDILRRARIPSRIEPSDNS
jgi:hypothetical protein